MKSAKNVVETIGFSDTCKLQNKVPGAKVIKCVSRFPFSFSFLLQEDLNNISLYDILKTKHKITFGISRKYIVMEFASFDVATYLNIEEGYPLLCIKSTVCSPDGQKIHRSKQLILGDRF